MINITKQYIEKSFFHRSTYLYIIHRLREDLKKMKEKILFPSESFANLYQEDEVQDKIRSADCSAIASLKDAAKSNFE